MKLTDKEYEEMMVFGDNLTSEWDKETFDALSGSEMLEWLEEVRNQMKSEFGTKKEREFDRRRKFETLGDILKNDPDTYYELEKYM